MIGGDPRLLPYLVNASMAPKSWVVGYARYWLGRYTSTAAGADGSAITELRRLGADFALSSNLFGQTRLRISNRRCQ